MGLSVGKVFMSATEPLFQSPSTLQIQNIKICTWPRARGRARERLVYLWGLCALYLQHWAA